MKVLFTTERLNICLAEEQDINSIMDLENHKDNNKFVCQGTYKEHLNEIDTEYCLLFVFKQKSDDKIIGFSLAFYYDKFDVFELRRIAISKKGCGYGKESIIGIIKYSFSKFNTNRFWLDVYINNKKGINLYKSIGMHLDGILRQSYKDDSGYRDQMIFSILREEYLENSK